MRRKYENINEPNPYARGRWYRIFVESDGSATTITSSDIEGITVTGNNINLPKYFHCIEYIGDYNGITNSAGKNVPYQVNIGTSGRQIITIINPSVYDWANIYIFGYSTE